MARAGFSRCAPAQTQPRKSSADLILLAILVGYFAARWPFRSALLIRDEGEYAQLAQQILDGALPYLDVYNQKTPFVFYLVAALQRLAGEGIEALRVATTTYGMLTACLVFLVARTLFGAVAALWGTLAFCVMTFDQCGIIHSASCEFFMLLWLAAALFLWYAGGAPRSPWRSALAGVCAGLAYQTKQSGLVVVLFFFADAVLAWLQGARSRSTFRRMGTELVLTGAGFIGVLGATLAFFAAQGGLSAYIECTWINNLQYVANRQHGLMQILVLLVKVVRNVARWDLGLWLLGSIGLAAIAARRPAPRGGGLWMLLAATLGMGLLTGTDRVHYYEPMIVPLSLGAAVACSWLTERMRRAKLRVVRLAWIACLTAPWVWPAQNVTSALRNPSGTLEQRVPRARDSQQAGRYLAAQTAPGEPILVIGSEPQVYYYARRPASSRMVFTYPMTGPYSFAPSMRGDFARQLREAGPRYVLLVKSPRSLSEYPLAATRFLRQVSRILEEKYVVERRFPDAGRLPGGATSAPLGQYLVVFRRKDMPPDRNRDETGGRALPDLREEGDAR